MLDLPRAACTWQEFVFVKTSDFPTWHSMVLFIWLHFISFYVPFHLIENRKCWLAGTSVWPVWNFVSLYLCLYPCICLCIHVFNNITSHQMRTIESQNAALPEQPCRIWKRELHVCPGKITQRVPLQLEQTHLSFPQFFAVVKRNRK